MAILKKYNDILLWLYTERDYQAGLLLLAKFGRNAALLSNLMKPGKERFGGHKKLTFQLAKICGLNLNDLPPEPEQEKVIEDIPAVTPTNAVEALIAVTKYVPVVSEIPLDQYPKIIRNIKYNYAEKYQARSRLFREMTSVPQTNTPDNMDLRAKLLKQINEITANMDFLYGFVIQYETNGAIPEKDTVWPKVVDKKALPEDVVELKKIKKNYQSSNVKDRNYLLYQNKTKQTKENPLPICPRRKDLEHAIKYREKLILEIDNKLVTLKYAD